MANENLGLLGFKVGMTQIYDENGDMNFNIAIRTMTIKNNKGIYPVGGGIVWDSNAKDEWQETKIKSKILSYLKC